MRRVVADIEDQKHRQLKIKTASDGLTIGDVISAAIDDYLAGKWKPTNRPALKGKRNG